MTIEARGGRVYPGSGTTLVAILDRLLDTGLIVAGDVRIALVASSC